MHNFYYIRTDHGNYRHDSKVIDISGLNDIEALIAIQRMSPYTPTFTFDSGNPHKRQILADFSESRHYGTPSYEPELGWTEGHSWTWIIRA